MRPPGSGWAFLYALTGRAAWCARGRRPAREIATRELCSARRHEARSGPTAAHGRRGQAHQSLRHCVSKLACALRSLRCPPHLWGRAALRGSARRLEDWPGSAAAHRRRSQALRTLRRPPHRRRCVADVCLHVASKTGQAPPPPTGAAARPTGLCPTVPPVPSTPVVPAVLCVGIRCFEARPGPAAAIVISHVIPPQLVQTLN